MKKILSNRFKSALIKFSHTKIGRGSWKIFTGAVNSYYPKRLLIKALNLTPQHDYSHVTVFPKISKSLSDKNALVVMPFYGNDAVGKNIDTKIATLKSLGFMVHVLVFNNSPWDSVNPEWDFVYNVKSKSNNFGKLKYDVNNQVVADGNKVDDWIDDEICQFVSALSAMNKFDLAIVNYVFLSKLCEYINPEAITIIDTHDVFAKRNTRMMQIGIKQDKFYFSTSKDEESKGLSRADYIFAIQEAEGRYFQESVNATVIVQPPILEANFINYRPVKDKKIIVGFMASGHYPNVVAINNFINSLVKYNPYIRLDIAGTICGSLVDGKHPKFVNILGFCDSLEGFYSSCDVIINPDELLSGMKVKCLEALSFGVPLVSTQAAMEGIESDADYHHLESAEKCAEFIASIKKDDLQDMANKSRELFIKFNERYCLETTLQQVMKENEK